MPAQVSAPADLTTFTTLFEDKVGSTTTLESSAPPNPIKPYSTVSSSKVTGRLI